MSTSLKQQLTTKLGAARAAQPPKQQRSGYSQSAPKIPKDIKFNPHQTFLYKRAMMGLSFYSKEEQKLMTPKKRDYVLKMHRKTEKILNLWRQEVCNKQTNSIFLQLFPKSNFTSDLIKHFGNDIDATYYNNQSFDELRISKIDIINKLIETRILPRNFYELKEDKPSIEKF